jgi:hypothetical protein
MVMVCGGGCDTGENFDEERSMSKSDNDEEERGQRRADHKCDYQQSPQHRKDPKKPSHCCNALPCLISLATSCRRSPTSTLL